MNIRVTIFEDNTNLRRGLTTLINGSEGFECAGAFGNCDKLITNITDTNPDVVLMDIEMPGMDGNEAVKMLKPRFPSVKILMETIFEDDEKVFYSICNGAEGYILKSSPPSQILEAIREIHEGTAPMTPSIASKVLALFKAGFTFSNSQSYNLTDRELEVLKFLVDGMSYKIIAEMCFINLETVNNHVTNIYLKLQEQSKSEAAVKANKGNKV